MKQQRTTLEQKLAAMTDPRRNDNAHERAVAAAKLAALKGHKPPPPGGGKMVTAASFARTYGLEPRAWRKKLRAAGKWAPYNWDDMEKVRNT